MSDDTRTHCLPISRVCSRELTSLIKLSRNIFCSIRVYQMSLKFVILWGHLNKVIYALSLLFLNDSALFYPLEVFNWSHVSKFNLLTKQPNKIFAVSHRRPRLQIRQDKTMALKLTSLLTFIIGNYTDNDEIIS